MPESKSKSDDGVSSLALSMDGGGRPKLAPIQAEDRARDSAQSTAGGSGLHGSPAPALMRTPQMDHRIALHESGHILAGKAFGFPVGLATIDPCDGYAGMVRASADASSFLSPEHVSDLCEKVRPLMPAIGDPRAEGNEFHAHAHCRVIELLAGTESERLFHADDPPLRAEHDQIEAKAFASIICTSPTSIDAFIQFARAEARAMLADHRHVVLALAHALVERRTLDGAEIDTIIAQAVAEMDLAAETARRRKWHAVEANAERLDINQSPMRRGASRDERIDEAVRLIREGASLRWASEAVRLPNAKRAIARRCDARGVPRKHSPAIPVFATTIPDPVIVPPRK